MRALKPIAIVLWALSASCSSSSDQTGGGDGGSASDASQTDGGQSSADGAANTCIGVFSGAFDATTGCKIEIGGAANKEVLFIAPLGPSGAQNIVIVLYPSLGELAVTSYAAGDLTSQSAIQTTGTNGIVYGSKPSDGTIQLVLTSVDSTPPPGELLLVSNTHGTLDATLLSSGDAGGIETLHVTF